MLDGTDSRVQILDQNMINSFPKAFGIGDTADTTTFHYAQSGVTDTGCAFFSESVKNVWTAQAFYVLFDYETEEHFTDKTIVQYTDGHEKELDIGGSSSPLASNVLFTDNESLQTKFDNHSIWGNCLKGKKLSILGDSISTFQGWLPDSTYAVWYPKTDVQSVEDTWWKKLINKTGMVIGQNCAWSGSRVTGNNGSTTSAQCGGSTKRVEDLAKNGTPDIIIIYIGINDFGQGNPVDLGEYTGETAVPTATTINTYSEAYGVMLAKVIRTYPNAAVYCCSMLDTSSTNWDPDATFPTVNSKGVSLVKWSKVIRDLCTAMGARFIDLHACGINYFNLPTLTMDGLHPKAAGHTLMANYIAGQIAKDFMYK